jgi:hypothetical protein
MSPDLKRKAAEIAGRLDFVNILVYVWVGNQFDLGAIKSKPGKSNGGGDIRILGILSGGVPSRALKMDRCSGTQIVQIQSRFRG